MNNRPEESQVTRKHDNIPKPIWNSSSSPERITQVINRRLKIRIRYILIIIFEKPNSLVSIEFQIARKIDLIFLK